MSSTFRPDTPDRSFDQAQQTWLRRAFNAVKDAWEAAKPHETLQFRHAAPERVEAGMLLAADGTDYNPGSGAGLYFRNEANSAWTYLGSGTGDVVGPASSVNNRVVFFDGVTGKLIKDSGLTLSGSNTGDQTITLTGDVTGSGTGSIAATVGEIGGHAVSLAGALTTSGAFASTFTMTGVTTVTFPTTGTLSTLAGAETLTNKTLTSPTINGGTHTGVTSLGLRNAGGGAFDLTVAYNTALASAGRTLTFDTLDANKTVMLAGNMSLFTPFVVQTSGSSTDTMTLRSTAVTDVTLPTTGTLATLAGTEALTNKTYAGSTVTMTGAITSSGGGIGYATGAGGTVTQATNKSTGVTLNKLCGTITMNGAALASQTTVSFVLTNSFIAAGDQVIVRHTSVGTLGAYNFAEAPAAGSVTISVRNLHTASLSEAIVLRFHVIKAVTA